MIDQKVKPKTKKTLEKTLNIFVTIVRQKFLRPNTKNTIHKTKLE